MSTVPGRSPGWGSERLRVAVIGPSRHPLRQPFAGGQEALVWHLVRGLREEGHEVTLFAAEGSDGADEELAFAGVEWAPSAAAALDVSMPARGFLDDHHRHLRLLLALGSTHSRSFDLVHNHSLHYLPLAMAPMLPVPMVTTLHTPPTPWLESAVVAGPGSVGRFAAVSRYVSRQWSLPDGPAEVVPNGVDTHTWVPGPGGDGLVWSGRIVPEKAPHLAARAARLAGRRLALVGPVHDEAYFDAMVRPELGSGIDYLGHLSSADLAHVVGHSAAALVTPVWDEPFGLVVAEALACGTPVVAFRRGGVPEVLDGRGVGVLVPPDDVSALAAAVEPASRLDRAAAREHAVSQLSVERMVSSYVDLYHRVLSGASEQDDLSA